LALLAGVTFIVAGGTTEADESRETPPLPAVCEELDWLVATGLT